MQENNMDESMMIDDDDQGELQRAIALSLSMDLSPMENAFLINDILVAIFGYLDLDSIRQARLVSKNWMKGATAVLAKKIVLDVNKVLDNNYTTVFPEVSDVLVRNIKFSSTSEIIWTKFIDFCWKYGTKIIELTVLELKASDNIEPLHQILDQLCPKVEFLKLSERYRYTVRNDGGGDFSTDLAVLPEFSKSLCLRSVCFTSNRDNSMSQKFDTFFNQILKSSVELITLKIEGIFFPDLTSNTKLKNLHLTGRSVKDPSSIFNLNHLNRIVKEVSNSLTNLIIDGHFGLVESAARPLQLAFLEVPQLTMNNMKTFTNRSTVHYPLFSLSIMGEKLANLTTLKLTNAVEDTFLDGEDWNIEKLFLKSGHWLKTHPHQQLTTLIMGEFENTEVIELVERYFPNISKLQFTYGKGFTISEQQFKIMIAVCSRLKLDSLRITLNVDISLSCLSDKLLEIPNFFAGLKTLAIKFGMMGKVFPRNSYPNIESWRNSSFYELLLRTGPLDRCEFNNLMLLTHEFMDMVKFVSEKKLPVVFT